MPKITGPGWPDRSGWYSIALFLQVIVYLFLYALVPNVKADDFWKTIGMALIVNGWIVIAVGGAKSEMERANTGKALDALKAATPAPPVDTINATAETINVTKEKS